MIAKATPFEMSQFRVVRHVTRPLLKIEEGTLYYIKVDSAIRQAEQMKNPKKIKQTQADGTVIEVIQPPPFVVDVTNLEGGTPSQMVCNEVFRTELQKQYPSDAYVGKYFELVKNSKAEGKNYNTFGITELEIVKDEAEQKQDAAKQTTPAATETAAKPDGKGATAKK